MVLARDSLPPAGDLDTDQFNLKVGSEVRRRREASELSLTDLAERAGLTRTFLWRVETGRQGLTVKSLAQVSLALGSTPSAVLDGIVWPPAPSSPPSNSPSVLDASAASGRSTDQRGSRIRRSDGKRKQGVKDDG